MKYRIFIYGNKKEHRFLRVVFTVTEYTEFGDVFEKETFVKAIVTKSCLGKRLGEEMPRMEVDHFMKNNKLSLYDTFDMTL